MVPVFLINYNLLKYTEAMCREISRMDNLYPIIVDNASYFPPLLEWYKTCPYEVVRLNQNYHQMVVWKLGLHLAYNCEEYIVSDPDLDLSGVPDDCYHYLKRGRELYPNCRKVGLGMRIDDLPDGSPVKTNAIGWETPFWSQPDGQGYFYAPIDTTFALYNKGTDYINFMNSMRCDNPYTFRHEPFYLTKDNIDYEMAFYFKSAFKAGGDATMPRYLQGLVQHYENNHGEIKLD